MKNVLKYLLFFIILCFPCCVFAMNCGGKDINNAINSNNFSFICREVKGNKVTFYYNDNEYSNFSWNSSNNVVSVSDSNFKFSDNIDKEYITIKAVDSGDTNNPSYIYVKNYAYVEPTTTTTTTTTTTSSNEKKVIVTMDYNDGTNTVKTEECVIKNNNSYCTVVIPNIESDTFSGWGTAKTCTSGNKGTFKVNKDITYYACYKTNEVNSFSLKTFKVMDKDKNTEIDFGTFDSNTDTYSFNVLYEVNNIDVVVDDGYTVILDNNTDLEVGENKVVVKVVDSSENSKEYTLNITKLKDGETLSNVLYLKTLLVYGYDINFQKDKLEYYLTIPSDIDNLDITAVSEDKNITPQILNNKNIIDGSVVKIILKSGDKSTIYKINITKEKKNTLLLYAIIGISVLIVILVILLIIKLGKKKNKSIKKDNSSDIEVLNV